MVIREWLADFMLLNFPRRLWSNTLSYGDRDWLEKQAKSEVMGSALVASSLILWDGSVSGHSTASQPFPTVQSTTHTSGTSTSPVLHSALSSDTISARKTGFENHWLKAKREKNVTVALLQGFPVPQNSGDNAGTEENNLPGLTAYTSVNQLLLVIGELPNIPQVGARSWTEHFT